MNTCLNDFEDLPAAVGRIDLLVYEASTARSEKERRDKLREANRIAAAYDEHCSTNGGMSNQFRLPKP